VLEWLGSNQISISTSVGLLAVLLGVGMAARSVGFRSLHRWAESIESRTDDRYHTFDESSIKFTVVLRGREFVDRFLLEHEFVKRLKARYAQEGIVIPFPIRAVESPEVWRR
jgi:hypothetical protein